MVAALMDLQSLQYLSPLSVVSSVYSWFAEKARLTGIYGTSPAVSCYHTVTQVNAPRLNPSQ